MRFSPTKGGFRPGTSRQVLCTTVRWGHCIRAGRPASSNSFKSSSLDESTLVAAGSGHAWFWSLPDLTPTRTLSFSDDSTVMERRQSTIDFRSSAHFACSRKGAIPIRSWPVTNGEPTVHGYWTSSGAVDWGIDETGANLLFADGRRVVSRPLDDLESNRNDRILLSRTTRSVKWFAQGPGGERIAFSDDIDRVYWRDLQAAGAICIELRPSRAYPFISTGRARISSTGTRWTSVLETRRATGRRLRRNQGADRVPSLHGHRASQRSLAHNCRRRSVVILPSRASISPDYFGSFH